MALIWTFNGVSGGLRRQWWFAGVSLGMLLFVVGLEVVRRKRHGVRRVANQGAGVQSGAANTAITIRADPGDSLTITGLTGNNSQHTYVATQSFQACFAAFARTSASLGVSLEQVRQAVGQLNSRGYLRLAAERSPKPVERSTVSDYGIAFRKWLVRHVETHPGSLELYLAALNHEYGLWQPGWNRAQCRLDAWEIMGAKHEAPRLDCQCGFYVRHVLPDDITEPVWGAVQVRGHVVDHDPEGSRVQQARVLALVRSVQESTANLNMLSRVAKHYEVPVLERNDLLRYAGEFGVWMGLEPPPTPPGLESRKIPF